MAGPCSDDARASFESALENDFYGRYHGRTARPRSDRTITDEEMAALMQAMTTDPESWPAS